MKHSEKPDTRRKTPFDPATRAGLASNDQATLENILHGLEKGEALLKLASGEPGRKSERDGLFLVLEGCWRLRFFRQGRVVEEEFPAPSLLLAPGGAWWSECGSGGVRSKVLIGFGPHHTYLHRSWHGVEGGPAERLVSLYRAKHPGLSFESAYRALRYLPTPASTSRRTAVCLLRALHEELRALFASEDGPSSSKAEATWQRLRHWLNYHQGVDLNRKTAAEAMCLHPNHLSRLARRFSGVGFQEYVTELKMDKAVRLLAETPLTVKEVAAECGYGDADHFGRMFKRRRGTPPRGKVKEAAPS